MQPLIDIVATTLNAAKVLLLIDGLDELPFEMQEGVYAELQALSYRLTSSKMIVTSRSGDFTRHLDGFDVLELVPLSPTQQETIARKWLKNADEFLYALQMLPYADTANRPLLLAQLMVLFERDGTLPEQPSRVYRRLVTLLLDEWNTKQGVKRTSKYSGFDAERKRDFLSALAYELTYVIRRREFSAAELTRAYQAIRQMFNLPKSEAADVVRELETHTGLLQTTEGDENFEFSHLSLQEYLCAEYLVRTSVPRVSRPYIREYVAPVAVAVALAGDPSEWLAAVLLERDNRILWNSEKLESFFQRLVTEQPGLKINPLLGVALGATWGRCDTEDCIGEFAKNPVVLASIREAITSNYVLLPGKAPLNEDTLVVAIADDSHNFDSSSYHIELPSRISIPYKVLKDVVATHGPVSWSDGSAFGKAQLGKDGETLIFRVGYD